MIRFTRREALAATGGGLVAAAAPLPKTLPKTMPKTMTVPKPDRELRIPVSGGSVHVRINGDLTAERAPLLMAHGGPGGCHAGLVPALALADERAVILWDQLDCGLSDAPGDPANWTVARFTDEIAAIRAALGLERLHLLGHSWGATIALEYAARQVPGLCSLVLQGPLVSTPRWIDDANRLRRQLPADVQAVLAACEGPNPPSADACAAATDAFYAQFWRREPLPAWLAAYEATIPNRHNAALYNFMWGANEFVCTGTLKDYDGTPLLARLTSPTLFLVGEYDEATPDAVREFARATRQAEVVIIPGAAHRIQSDRMEACNAALRRWMTRFD